MDLNSEESQEQNQFEGLIQGLIDDQYGCCNDFLIPSAIAGLRANITTLNASGNMKEAGVSNRIDFKIDKLVRSDKVNWIAEKSTNQFEAIYLKKIWKFINYLNNTCYTSIKSFESHYAHYEPGNFYLRHLDQFKNENGRKFSIVLYLNQDWKKGDGGRLSLYPLTGKQKNISPLGGRLVFFRSNEMEHEVHPSLTRNRSSIAGWFKN